MALDDFSKGYYEKRRAMMGRAPVQDSGDVMRKVNKQVYQAERSRPVLEQAAAEMQTEGRERSIGERIGKTISGAAKSYLSSLTNAGGDAARTQGGLWRDFTRDSVREWQQEIDRWERDLSAWRADGSLTREEEEDLTGMIQANREKIATYTMAQGGRRGSAEAARGLADQIALSGARDTDQAKEGIGAAGQFAVDSGTGLVHLAGDIGLGAMTGGAAAIPLAVRSYGGSSQKARLEGANDDRAALYGLTSAAMEVATGMLGNVGRINSKFFGGGAVDDVVEGMVRALERKGGGKLSRALLNRAGTAAAGFVTEGAEEALSAIIDPFLRRAIYSDDPLDAGEILGDALYDFAVGGAVGGIAGGIGGTDTTRGLRSAERNADAAIDRAYDAMGSAGPWSPAAAEAVREANGLLEQAAWAAAETDGISGKAADRILRDESALEQLRQETGLELSNDMTQSERRAAVKQAANWLAVLQKEQGQAGVRAVGGKRESVREERRADGDIGPYGVENRTAGGEKQTAAKRAYDTKRVLDGARAFGESGAKALAAAYDGRTDAESYYGGFASYYQAGISNMDMRKVRSEYGAQLSEAQKYAAYVAGQNDAILSIQRERQAAPYAKSAGSDSGLVYDDFVRQAVESGRSASGETGPAYLTQKTAERVNSVAKALGLRVRFVDQVDGDRANASIQGSEVQIQKNNPLPVQFLMGHEVTHRLQELAPEEYRTFREAAAQDEMVQIYARRYAEGDSGLTYEQALDEAAADYAGRMMEDGKVLDRFIEAHKENRTLLEKVRDAIRAIVRKLTGAEKKQAQTAEGKLTAALEAAAKRVETLQKRQGDGTMDTTRYSLKEDGDHGRAREETRAESQDDFKRRCLSEGYEVVVGGEVLYGFRRLDWEFAGENARQVQEEVSHLGLDVDIISGGQILRNANGVTVPRTVSQATTIARSHVLINNNTTLSPRNIAGHEAFHYWKTGIGRNVYIETVQDNLDFSNADFLEYQTSIANAYFGDEADLSDPVQEAIFTEELFAFISGDIHEGVNDDFLRPMFRDFDAVRAAWEQLVEENRDRTTRSRYSLKEDGKNGRKEVERGVEGTIQQDHAGGAGGNGQPAGEDGGYGDLRSVRRMSQGQRPVHSWAEGGLTVLEPGSVAESEAHVVQDEYNLPVFVVKSDTFNQNHATAPAFSSRGQVFLRENLPESGRGDIGAHEAGHAMKQLGYQPYLDFIDQAPDFVDQSTREAGVLMEGAAQHLGIDLFDMSEQDTVNLFDEINNIVYGAIHAGRTEILELVRPAFFDFDTYAAELSEIHEQFKRERRGTKTHESRKGFSVDRELDREIRQIVKEAREGGKSEEAVQADIRALVQESYRRMAEQYGTIPTGERPTREVRIPRKTAEDKKVSQTVRTILEAGATPETAIPNIEELMARGVFSYTQYTDKQAMKDAEGTIRDKGYASALSDWTNRVRSGEVSKRNTAEGWVLYNNAANSGDMKSAMTILTNMVEHQRNAAQAVQATRILKQLPPDVQLYGVARSVRNLQEELTRRYGKNAPDLKIDEKLAGRVLSARTQKARDEALQELYRDIGRQLPSRFVDKWNAWRYLAMLGNVRTHVRNVVGNAGFLPVAAVKDLTATAIEAAVSRVSGGKLNRSKALVGAGKGDRALLKAAWGDYANVQDAAMSGRKYDDLSNANQYIEEGRVIFKTKALEKIRRANSHLLEGEDQLFSKPHYAYAMAQYCKANGITAEQIAAGKGLDRAREYAVLEAQKATYRDTNAFSYLISRRFREQGEYKNAAHAANMLADGVLPFRKTPANILVRGVEYSPLGLLTGLKQALWDVRQGTRTGAEAIDSISAGLTGTGLMALGIYLAAEGLIRGHGSDDDKEKQFEELMGHQAYALELPDGTSVTLDWLAPEALPFFVGVNLWEQTGKGKERATLADLLSATATVTEPLLEMSCLQSLNAVFDAVGYARDEGMDGLTKALASAATSFLTQAQPTLLGQVERALEDKRYTTYLEQDGFLTGDMQYALGKASARTPGWDFQQIPYIDAWGRTERTGTAGARSFNNFLNPAYTSSVNESEMEQELLRLYQATGMASVLPRRAERSFPVNEEEKHLNAREYVKYAREKGQTAYTILEELTRSEPYRTMNDEERAETVSKAYAYASAWAKTRVSDYEPEDWTRKAIEVCRDTGMKPAVYVPLYLEQGSVQSLKDKNGETIDNSASLLKMELVYRQKGLNDKQRQALFKAFGVGKSVMHLNKAAVTEKLARMRKQAG